MRGGFDKDDPAISEMTISRIVGIGNYIFDVKDSNDNRSISEKRKSPTSAHRLYELLLYFKNFHTNEYPMLICEGKTDEIYLRSALRRLHAKFPKLASSGPDGIELKVRFFRYSEKSMKALHFSGGTGDLAAFIGRYDQKMRKFKSTGSGNPVIVVCDNDEASKKIFSSASSITGKKVDGSKKFYDLKHDLRLVTFPKKTGVKNFIIEDCFDKSTLSVVIDGKKFEPDEAKFDSSKHYGKSIFADAVVRKNESSIDFSGFEPILKRIEEACG